MEKESPSASGKIKYMGNMEYHHRAMLFYDILEIDHTATIFSSRGINLIVLTSTAE